MILYGIIILDGVVLDYVKCNNDEEEQTVNADDEKRPEVRAPGACSRRGRSPREDFLPPLYTSACWRVDDQQ